MMARKEHLTAEGLAKIKSIVLLMNKSVLFTETEQFEVSGEPSVLRS
jgi:hypothetical protein